MRRRKTIKAWDMIENKSNSGDRISELPDAILIHILSFLDDTKYVVQTSSLSKRWTTLWTSLTSLYFNDSSFRKLSNFEHFICHVLTGRDNSISINNFVFTCKKQITSFFFENVINYATSNRIINLEVCIKCIRFYSIPYNIFSAVSLRTLKLNSILKFSTKIDTQLCFQHLELLHLEGFLFEGSDDNAIFLKCENLVELSIVDCDISSSDRLIISAPQLARLSICYNSWDPARYPEKLEVVLSSSPKLTEFNFEGIERTLILRTNDELCLLQTGRNRFDHFYTMDGIGKSKFQEELSQVVKKMVREFKIAHPVSPSIPNIEESIRDGDVTGVSERIGKGGLHVYEFEYKLDSTRFGMKMIFSPAFATTKVYLQKIYHSDKPESPLDMHRRTILDRILHSFDTSAPPPT